MRWRRGPPNRIMIDIIIILIVLRVDAYAPSLATAQLLSGALVASRYTSSSPHAHFAKANVPRILQDEQFLVRSR